MTRHVGMGSGGQKGRVRRLGDASGVRWGRADGRLWHRSQSASPEAAAYAAHARPRNLCGLRRRSRSYRFPRLAGHSSSSLLYHRPFPAMSPRPVRVPPPGTSSPPPLPTPRWPSPCTRLPSWTRPSTTRLCSNSSSSTCLATSSVHHPLSRLPYIALTFHRRAHR